MVEPQGHADAPAGGQQAETGSADRRARTWLSLQVLTATVVASFVLASFYTFYVARVILVPIALAVLLKLLLTPLVRRLNRLGIPEGIGAALVLVVALCGAGVGIYRLSEPAAEWMARAPSVLLELESRLRPVTETVEEVKKATEKVEEMADLGSESPGREVVVEGPSVTASFLSGTGRFLAAAAITIVLLYFLLAAGDLFLRKLVRVLPRLKDKRRAVEIARQIEREISTYLVTITAINAALGIVTGVAMFALGMPNPVLWGAMVAVLNYVPFIGPIVAACILALVAIVTFDDAIRIALPPAVFILLANLEGNFLTPIALGRQLTLNPVVIFLSLLVWGWLWGMPGVLLSVPMLAALKIFCDNIGPLAPVGEFLGRRE